VTAAAPGGARGRERTFSPLMVAVAAGSILVPLNSTMLAVALPGIMGQFALGANQVSSVVTLYLGAVAVALPVSGTLGDRFGHGRTFVAGVLVFGLASLAAAVGQSFVLLEVARVVQAGSGALISTASAAIIRDIAPPDRRGAAFGLFDLLTSTSAAIGPFIGGVIVGAFGWRAMFWLAVPIAIASALAVRTLLPRQTPAGLEAPASVAVVTRRPPLDLAGLGVLALAIVAFLAALRIGPTGLGLIALVALVPLVVAFLVIELRSAHPAIDPRLFRSRTFGSAAVAVFGATAVLHGCFFLIPLLVERLLDSNATVTGIVLLGIAGVSALVAPWGGRTSDRVGRRRLAVAGSVVVAAGLAGLAAEVALGASGDRAPALVAIGVLLGVVGLGLGLSGSPRQTAALETVARERVGMAAGTYLTARYLGGVVGASLGGAVLAGAVTISGVAFGFAILVAIAVGVAIVSTGLPGPRAPA